jgi:hypothetical protein
VWFLIFVVVVIVVVLAQRLMKETAKDPDTCLDLEPWKEWRLRESNPKALQMLSEEQPDITKGVRYDVNVNYQDEGRGQLYLVIQPDGMVMGAWNGHYHKEKSKLSIDIQNGDFAGYVCPLKIYRDENGEDPSKLYFIAKGDFLIHESDLESKYHIITGALYVTGWIDADYAVRGKIVITSDEKYSEIYDWRAYNLVRK